MGERIRTILRKEFIQALREPRMRFLLFFPPLLQLVVFGYAVTLDVDHARIAWMDMDNTPESRALEARFLGSGRFDIIATPRSEQETQTLLDRGQVHGVVRVLPGFARDLARGRATEVQVLLDGTNSNTASLVSAYAQQVIGAYSGDVMTAQSKNRQTIKVEIRGPGAVGHVLTPATAESRVWFNPDLYSRNYFVPGVAANILFMVTLMLTSQAIIREKEIGTMEQLMVTPMRPIELMLGKTLPFALVGLINLLVIVGGALLIFHVPFRGNFLLLLFCAILFLMTSLGAGLLLSTMSQTQQQANMGSFFFTTPAFVMSGFMFPIHNMPLAVQYLAYLNPLRYFMEIVRGIFLKGVGVAALWPQMLCLFVYGTAILLFSAARFRKTLD
ncbi:MAG TPA: ABC transporter permease [Bryobacteraceae bacterium]|jgi:ABC-2 type transport system permease protein|nr:ABC transporter permease [Bryobacteraceae bacterium]